MAGRLKKLPPTTLFLSQLCSYSLYLFAAFIHRSSLEKNEGIRSDIPVFFVNLGVV